VPLFFIVIFALVFGRGMTILLSRKKYAKNAQAIMEAFIGEKPLYIDTGYSCSDSKGKTICGTGLAYANQCFYIMDHGLCAKLTIEDIRSWKWVIAGTSGINMLVGGGGMEAVANASVASMQQSSAKFAAWVESGFFISVADIDKPVWQFMTTDEKVLTKWMEIFEQVQEGKL